MTARPRILFVDDEVQILDGLQNLLRKQRRQWDMDFAAGGTAALDAFAKSPFDVIVSDMRMPGMDGAALLSHVRDNFPATIRIVLSGHAEQDAMLRALPVAHQFRTKPCDAAVLRAVLERTTGLLSLVPEEAVRAALGRLERLPSQPRAYFALSEAFAKGDPGEALATLVAQDPAITAKLLQLANSGFFGHGETTSVPQAVRGLGFELIRSFALTARVFGTAEGEVDGALLEALSRTATLAAGLAERFAEGEDTRGRGLATTASLLHRVGHLAMAVALPDRAKNAADYPEVGAYLLGIWGLPSTITDLVLARPTEETSAPTIGRAVRAANQFAAVPQGLTTPHSFEPPAAWRVIADETLAGHAM